MWKQPFVLHPKLRDTNLHYITHSLISRNPMERMLKSHSILSHFSPLYHKFVINANHTTKEVNPHPRITPRVNMWSVTFFLFFFFSYHIAQEGPTGVDRTNRDERRMNSNSTVSHATRILQYQASMLTLQKSVISRAHRLPRA